MNTYFEITIENRKSINECLKEYRGKSYMYVITTYDRLVHELKRVQLELDALLAEDMQEGVYCDLFSGYDLVDESPYVNRHATRVLCRKTETGWALIQVQSILIGRIVPKTRFFSIQYKEISASGKKATSV